MIDSATYQKNINAMTQLVQELLIISAQGFWLTSGLMHQCIKSGSVPQLKKKYGLYMKGTEEFSTDKEFSIDKMYFLEHLSEKERQKLIQLNPYPLEIRGRFLVLASEKKVDPPLNYKGRDIYHCLDRLFFYQERLKNRDGLFDAIEQFILTAAEINDRMKDLYGFPLGCMDYYEFDFGSYYGEPGERMLRRITLQNDIDEEYLPANVELKLEQANYLLRWIQESFLDISKGTDRNNQSNIIEEIVKTQPNPIRWKGTDADLIDLFATLRGKHYIGACSDYELIKQIVLHFTGKKGKQLKFENLKSTLKTRKNFGNEPFNSIPENAKPE
jgi:hypothetical protein